MELILIKKYDQDYQILIICPTYNKCHRQMTKQNIFSPSTIILCVLLFLVIVYLLSGKCNKKCSMDGYTRYGGLPYSESCEFQPGCLWDAARTIQLSNGMSGVCTLHGIACPSFSTDHDRERTMGLTSIIESDNYIDRAVKSMEGFDSSLNYIISELENNPDYSGLNSSLGLGMYPTE